MYRLCSFLPVPLVIIHLSASAAEKAPTVSGAFPADATFQSFPLGNVSQTRSPDNGALSIIFDSVRMDDQSMGKSVGVALVTAIVPVEPIRSTYIAIDLRGNATVEGEGRCRAVLTTPFGTITALPKKSGDIFARWKVPVQETTQEFSFTVILQCHRVSGSVNAAIDSVELTWGTFPRK